MLVANRQETIVFVQLAFWLFSAASETPGIVSIFLATLDERRHGGSALKAPHRDPEVRAVFSTHLDDGAYPQVHNERVGSSSPLSRQYH